MITHEPSFQQEFTPVTPWGNFTADEEKYIQQHLQTGVPREFLKSRPCRGGKRVDYIEGGTQLEIANSLFGHNGWRSSILQITVEVCEQQGGFWVYSVFAIVRVQLKSGAAHDDVGCGAGRDKDRMRSMEAAKKGAVTDARKRALRCFGELLGNSLKHHDSHSGHMPATDEHQSRNATPPGGQMRTRDQNQQDHEHSNAEHHQSNQVKQQQLKEQQERNRQAALARQKQNQQRQQPLHAQKRNSLPTAAKQACHEQQQFDYNLPPVPDDYGNTVDSEIDTLAMLEVAEQMEAQHAEANAKRLRTR